jgi:vacuolar-type H+-ATPase subunit H
MKTEYTRNAHYPEHRNILAELEADAKDALEEMDATAQDEADEEARREWEEASAEALDWVKRGLWS